MTVISIRNSAWYGDNIFELKLPENWDIKINSASPIKCITKDEITTKLELFIKKIIGKKKNVFNRVALIVDDISRPTTVKDIIVELANILNEYGINNKSIYIILAVGTHDEMTEEQILRKLGSKIVSEYNVSSHNCHKNTVFYKKTKNGTPIHINQILKNCDLKIGVGGTYPHSPSGFGGGAKILLGVCGFKTITHLHYSFSGVEIGGILDNEFRHELEEIGRIVGLNGMVNIILGEKRDIIDIRAGNFIESHKQASAIYSKIYCTSAPGDADVVIINTYPFDTTLLFSQKGWWPIHMSKKGATNILIGSLPMGIGNHGIHPISNNKAELILNKLKVLKSLTLMKLIEIIIRKVNEKKQNKSKKNDERDVIFYRTKCDRKPTINYSVFCIYESWKDVVGYLKKKYKNKKLKIVVYAYSPLQFPNLKV
jgi:nickel-dependent lactate racemase